MHTVLPMYSLPGEQKAVKLPLTTNKFPVSNTHQLPGNNPAITLYLHTGEQKSCRRGAEEEQKNLGWKQGSSGKVGE
jgi:hypothetical protein